MKNVILTSIVFNILYNYQEILNRFNFHQLSPLETGFIILKNIILSQLMVSAFFVLISFNVILYRILVPFIFMISNLVGGAKIMYGVVLDQSLVRSIFQTNFREISEFMSMMFVMPGAVSFMIGAFLCYSPNFRKLGNRSLLTVGISLLLFISGVFINKLAVNANFMPYNIFKETIDYATNEASDGNRTEIGYKHLEKVGDENLTVILVIGESARGDHFGINGYDRDTTPSLAKIDNLISYKNARSCSASTHISVLCMLTRGTENDKTAISQEKSFISLFKKLGFKTLWVGAQGSSDVDRVYYVSSREADNRIFGEDILGYQFYDHNLLKTIENFVLEPGNKLVIFHTMGSHFDYNLRYPKDFERFVPVENRMNAYDNSIYYTDYVLSSLIKLIENKNSFLIYSSDHGESLGENGVFLHGQDYIKEQRIVPFIVYASDKYISHNKESFDNLKSHFEVSHDNIFHTILDCANIKSDILDRQLSLCRKHENLSKR